MAKLTINGRQRQVQVDGAKPLLWVLREDLGLRGTKYGCGKGLCGACTVHIDGVAVRSCVIPVANIEGQNVRTIEGANDAIGQALKKQWVDHNVAQCGYCQVGQIMAAHYLLSKRDKGAAPKTRNKLTNHCRCGTYGRIHKAVQAAADQLDGKE